MVERSTCATDARGAEASLTRAGLDRLRAASTTHLDGVRRYFLDSIDADGPRRRSTRGLGQRDGRPRRAAAVGDSRRTRGRRLTPGRVTAAGRVLAGTSGFAYAGLGAAVLPGRARESRDLLPHYAVAARRRAS